MVTDLRHFLEVSPAAPGPTRRLAAHLGTVVKAATGGRRRDRVGDRAALPSPTGLPALHGTADRDTHPTRHPHPLAMRRLRRCRSHQQLGDSPFDLRRRRLTLAVQTRLVVVPDGVATALRDLILLDSDTDRLVHRMRHHHEGAALAATDNELDDLLGALATEANHEPDRRRRQRLDTALDTLEHATADRS